MRFSPRIWRIMANLKKGLYQDFWLQAVSYELKAECNPPDRSERDPSPKNPRRLAASVALSQVEWAVKKVRPQILDPRIETATLRRAGCRCRTASRQAPSGF